MSMSIYIDYLCIPIYMSFVTKLVIKKNAEKYMQQSFTVTQLLAHIVYAFTRKYIYTSRIRISHIPSNREFAGSMNWIENLNTEIIAIHF